MKYALIFCAAVALTPNPATAQTLCSPRVEVVTNLAKKYSEVPVSVGVTNDGRLVEVLSTSDGKTWTIILSDPSGISCLVAAGEGWRILQPAHTKLDPQT